MRKKAKKTSIKLKPKSTQKSSTSSTETINRTETMIKIHKEIAHGRQRSFFDVSVLRGWLVWVSIFVWVELG